MEGKETRFGIAASALFAAVATGTSTGAVNTMHDSMMPLGGLVPLFLIQLGELAPGGVGTGMYTMLIFAMTPLEGPVHPCEAGRVTPNIVQAQARAGR